MNISKAEQRTLHVLVRGGAIVVERNDDRKIVGVICATREGWALVDCTLGVFRRLKRRKLIASANGAPYEITLLGRKAVRSQPDNRA